MPSFNKVNAIKKKNDEVSAYNYISMQVIYLIPDLAMVLNLKSTYYE